MPFRNVFIQNQAYISTNNEQLIIRTDDEYSIPIEDINAVLLENRQVTITSGAMSKLAQYGTTVFVCDEKHLPCGVYLPMSQHSRELKCLSLQISQSKPKLKRLWQQVVRRKILNQAACLEKCGGNGSEKLIVIAERVQSGDTGNAEAFAANYYFRKLFGENFTRHTPCLRNSSLNYGYAILRGTVAKMLAVYGFNTALGIHHCNKLNNFNLADDLLEPLRPLVDLYVRLNISDDEGELGPSIKHGLLNLLNMEVEIDSKKHSATYAVEIMIQSLGRCFEDTARQLNLPSLTGLSLHVYD